MELTIITKKTQTIYVYPKLIRVETFFGKYDIYFFDEKGNIRLHEVKQDNIKELQLVLDKSEEPMNTNISLIELYDIDGEDIE